MCYLCRGYRGIARSGAFGLTVLLLTLVCVLVFRASNWFLFFFFFESSLIPIVVLILGWGYQPERLQAAFYLLIYTICVSLPMLLVLVYKCSSIGRNSFYIVGDWVWGNYERAIVILLLLGSFLVKSPIFLVHL